MRHWIEERRSVAMGCVVTLAFACAMSPALGAEIQLRGQATDQHGTEHDLAELANALLVVDFAASWCEPCYDALPKLQTLAQQYPHVRFVVVSVDDTSAGRDRLVHDLKLELPVLWDQDHHIVEDFSPSGFPATYVVANGRIVHQHVGTGGEEWEALVTFLDTVSRKGTAAP